MKTTIVFVLLFLQISMADAQVDNLKSVTPPSRNVQKIINEGSSATVKNSSWDAPRPIVTDLKFISYNVRLNPPSSGQKDFYNLTVSCKIRNDGKVNVPLDSVGVQTYLTDYNYWVIQGHTDFSRILPTGGRSFGWRRGEILAPGAEVESNWTIFNLCVPANPSPLFLFQLQVAGNVQDINAADNLKQYSLNP